MSDRPAEAKGERAEARGERAEARVEVEAPIGRLVIDHPARRNAMTLEMWQAIPDLCARLDGLDEVRVVVVRGAGEQAFVAGADISQFGENRQGGQASAYDDAVAAAQEAIENLAKPTLALIHGFCIGGGLGLALAADVRFGADDARFALPPAKLGIGYSAHGIGRLVDLVGPAVAREIIYTGELFDADTALRWGLLNHRVAKADLDRHVDEQARIMASRAPLSQQAAKLAVADHLRDPADRRPGEVAAAIARCFDSDDYAEGVAAFMERRAPVFRGS